MNGDYYLITDASGIKAYLFIDKKWIQVSEKLFILKDSLDTKPYNGNRPVINEYCSLIPIR